MLAPGYAALGRLYDPLSQLAKNIHRGMSDKRMVVWADGKGRVFVNDPDYVKSLTPHSIIGTYDAYTPLSIIEADLRRGLRERASSWILDWNTQASTHGTNPSRLISPTLRPSRRSRKLKAANGGATAQALGD